MPEPRDRITSGVPMRELTAGRRMQCGYYQERLKQALSKELAAGQGFRRRFCHFEVTGVSTATRSQVGRSPAPVECKENVPPKSMLCHARARRSPLPDCHPRAPLQDITALLNAMARRRASLQSTARQQRNRYNMLPSCASPVSKLPQKINVSHACLIPNVYDTSSRPVTPISGSPATERSPQTHYISECALPDYQALDECEMKREKSIIAIETAVSENMKKKLKIVHNSTQSTLMSMR